MVEGVSRCDMDCTGDRHASQEGLLVVCPDHVPYSKPASYQILTCRPAERYLPAADSIAKSRYDHEREGDDGILDCMRYFQSLGHDVRLVSQASPPFRIRNCVALPVAS